MKEAPVSDQKLPVKPGASHLGTTQSRNNCQKEVWDNTNPAEGGFSKKRELEPWVSMGILLG